MNEIHYEGLVAKSFMDMENGEFGVITRGRAWIGLVVMKMSTGNIVCLSDGTVIPTCDRNYRHAVVRIEKRITIDAQ
jgi:hypothetical protein